MIDLDAQRHEAVSVALRATAASIVCILVTEWLTLENGYLSVFSVGTILLDPQKPPFQKGVERLVGRIGGLLYSTVVILLFKGDPVLCLAWLAVGLFPIWYLQSAGRFAYGDLLLAVFTAETIAVGLNAAPGTAIHTLYNNAVQVCLGFFAVEAINIGLGFEKVAPITSGATGPLFPLRADWVSRSLRLTVLGVLATVVALVFELPPPTVVSAIILGSAPDLAAIEVKGIQRAVAVAIALAYSLLVLLLVGKIMSLALLVAMLCLAVFASMYVAKYSTRHSYIGLQCTLVVPMLVVVPANEIAYLDKGLTRLVGVAAGFAMAFCLHALWPNIPPPVEKQPATHS